MIGTVTVWPDGVFVFQDWFDTRDWGVFREAACSGSTVDLEECMSSILHCIRKCVEDMTTSRTIIIPPNQKPWVSTEVSSLL